MRISDWSSDVCSSDLIAGVPAVVAGFNGKLGWGMTMVMGDNQDLYLEQVRREGSRLMYLADGKWLQARERHETYFVKGERPIRETIYETRNGPLLNTALGERKRSEEHTSELQSIMRTPYAVFFLKKKKHS